MASDYLLEWLDAFNRKERYYLISQALGGFGLTPQFAAALGERAGVQIPSNAQAWMDYHLDWVYAAMKVAGQPTSLDHTPFELSPNFAQPEKDAGPVYVNHDTEDIDLLVAFRKEDINHLIFVEAKGETAWSNSQMESKAFRLKKVFAAAPDNVRAVLVLASPTEPRFLRVPEERPDWVSLSPTTWRHLQLDVPRGRRKIVTPSKQHPLPESEAGQHPEHPKEAWWRVAPAARSDLTSD